jgi:hypothetical protein
MSAKCRLPGPLPLFLDAPREGPNPRPHSIAGPSLRGRRRYSGATPHPGGTLPRDRPSDLTRERGGGVFRPACDVRCSGGALPTAERER